MFFQKGGSMLTFARTGLLIASLVFLSACASLNTTKAPDADLSKINTIYVQKLTGEEADIDKLLVSRLNEMGYQATTGKEETPPAQVDAIVTYVDRWMWDLTMYMIRLTVQIRDGSSRAILASAESYRPSLQRKSPEFMVKEVLEKIFQNEQQ